MQYANPHRHLCPMLALVAAGLFGGPAAMDASQPTPGGKLVPRVERHLREAFPIARKRIAERPSCGRLFEPFGRAGALALAVTRYRSATLVEEKRHCRGASAFTAVGSPVTRLCRSFARLTAERAALVLIHEALHYAGMPESPAAPAALDSAAINRLVADSCRSVRGR